MKGLPEQWQAATVLSADGQHKLRVGIYLPHEGVEPKRWFVFTNGRAEYIEKYPNLPVDLQLSKDVGFMTWDHQGQGQSEGPRSHIDTYDTFAKDLELLIRKYVGDLPFMLTGHSMGGLIALYATQKLQLKPEALALFSPLLKMPARPFKPDIAKTISEVAIISGLGQISTGVGKHKAGESFVGNRYTHCKKTYEHIQRTPYQCPGATFGWARATQEAIEYVFQKKNIASIACPVLILGGSEEVVVDSRGWSDWAINAQQIGVNVTYHIIPGARHELFSEIPKYREHAVRFMRESNHQFFQFALKSKTA